MLMVSLNQSIVANADSVLQGFVPEMSPLERDIAVCGTVNNRGEAPVPTAVRYEWPHVEWADFSFELLRVAGSLDALSVIPYVGVVPGSGNLAGPTAAVLAP